MYKIIAMALALGVYTSGASAQQQNCFPSEEVIEFLANEHEEQPFAIGSRRGGDLMMVYGNTTTGSWSVVAHRPDGLSCFLDSGEGFTLLPPSLRGGDS